MGDVYLLSVLSSISVVILDNEYIIEEVRESNN